MSAVLRLLLAAGLVLVVGLIVLQPRRLQRFGKQIRLVGFLYVAAVLVSAALRLSGILEGT